MLKWVWVVIATMLVGGPVRGQVELSDEEYIYLDSLFESAYEAFIAEDFTAANTTIDAFIDLALEKREGYYGIIIGLAYKAYFAEDQDDLVAYYAAIQKIEELLPEFMEELGEEGKTMYVDNKIQLALYHRRKGSFLKARQQLNTLYQAHQKGLPVADYQFVILLLHLGSINKVIGSHELALIYTQECLSVYRSTRPEELESNYEALIYAHMASIYRSMEEQEQAITYYQKALDLQKNVSLDVRRNRNRVISTYDAFAELYLENQEPTKAVTLLRQSLTKHRPNDYLYEETYRLLGKAHAQLREEEKAIEYFKQSMETSLVQGKEYQQAKTYLEEGKMYTAFGKYEPALAAYQLALVNLDNAFDEATDYQRNPSSFQGVFARNILLEVLHQKALTLDLAAATQPDYRAAAFQTIQTAVALSDEMRKDYNLESDKQNFVEETLAMLEDAIRIALAQPNGTEIDYAWEVSERSKSLLLLEAVRQSQIENYNVPDSLLDKEALFQFSLRELKEQRYEAQQSGDEAAAIEADIAQVLQQLDALNQQLQQYPSYYNLRKQQQVVSVEQVQQGLANDQAVLSYFIGEQHAYLFLADADTPVQCVQLSLTQDQLKTHIRDFITAINRPFAGKVKIAGPGDNRYLESEEDFAHQQLAQSGYALYQLLLAPVAEQLQDLNAKRLTIIPAGVLNYLPFDALLQAPVAQEKLGLYENAADYPFLVYDYDISYCYSATLLSIMQAAHTVDNQEGMLAFDIPEGWSEQQTQTIATLWDDSNYVNRLQDQSNLASLLAQGANYRTIHFATHGLLDNERPNLSSLMLRPDTQGDTLLQVQQLYSLSLPVELVFTASCDAGIGQLSKGEGLLSLARGFVYAGAKSLVTTLWSIGVGSSNQLVLQFYTNLKEGMAKDEALAAAKKEMIQQPETAHPYHWAGFVPIGNMAPMEKSWWSALSIDSYGLLLAVVLALIFVFRLAYRLIRPPMG